MSKKQHQAVLAVSVILFSLWRSFIPFAVTLNAEGGNSIIWFLVLYLFAAYLRKYGVPIKSSGMCLAITSMLLLFSFITNVGISYVSTLIGFGGKGASLFTEFTSFPMLFASILLLCTFLNLPENHIRERSRICSIVLFFSTSTFSVYLIHENKYLKPFLWKWIDVLRVADSTWVVLYVIMLALLIFVVATCLDKILFVPVQRLIRKIQLAKIQKVIDNYLYD